MTAEFFSPSREPIPRTADWKPSAGIDTLRRRSRLLQTVRQTLLDHGYWEVATPVCSQESIVDAHLDPLPVDAGAGDVRYLLTSPEFAMKRLLAAGADAIFQIGPAFRRAERGRWHNPEFTMVEWYRAGKTWTGQMQFVEKMLQKTAGLADVPFPRTTYAAAFARTLGLDPHAATVRELADAARAAEVSVPPGLDENDRDGWLNLLLAERIEPGLGRGVPEFLVEYPATQSALARVRPGPPAVAERFELYWRGVELCNGYQELLDPDELRRRCDEQARLRRREGAPPLPFPVRLQAAMQSGLPDCSGVALGFDRLAALVLGADTIDAVLAFPWERA